ncbi:MAG: DEAD/DEAH box helicase [Methanobacteriota archaeon]
MIILQGLYSPVYPDHLILFGEDTCRSNEILPPSAKQGRKSKIPAPKNHPFAVSNEDFTRLFRKLRIIIPRIDENTLYFSIPALDNAPDKPLCSPEYYTHLGQISPSTSGFTLWSVPGFKIPFEYISILLSGLIDADSGLFTAGKSFRYWVAAYRYAIRLITTGHYLPSYRMVGRAGFRSVWDIRPDSAEKDALSALVEAIPLFCIPATGFGVHDSDMEDFSAEYTINSFITSFIRRTIYESLAETPADFPMTHTVMIQQTVQMMYYLGLTGQGNLLGMDGQAPTDHGDGEKIISWVQLPPEDKNLVPLTLVIRILEPAGEGAHWYICYELRPDDDPTCLIPAGTIWSGERVLSRSLPPLHILEETLLQELGRGAVVSPYIRDSLQCPAPDGFVLSTADIWEFLTREVPRLKEVGIETIIPSWWTERKIQPMIRIRAERELNATSWFGLDTIVSFDYQIALGDEILTPEEFFKRTELKNSIIRTKDGWMVFDMMDLAKNLTRLQEIYQNRDLTSRDLLKLSSRMGEGGYGDFEVVGSDSWCRDLIDSVRSGLPAGDRDVPSSFIGTLRPYQVTGYSFLVFSAERGMGACLADDMGLGKTPQTIAYLLAKRDSGIDGPSLIICPTSVAGNWERELQRFAPSLTSYIHHGTGREKAGFSELVSGHDLVITTYPLVGRDHDLISSVQWSSIILDEAQNIKNSRTKQAKSIYNLNARHRIALTGTPVENRLSELWSIMQFLNPGYLGGSQQFKEQYAIPIERDHDHHKTIEMRRLIRPFLLRRLKTDRSIIQDLPDKVESRLYVTLTREQVTLYQAVVNQVRDTADSLSGIARRGMILGALTKLKQISDHPHLFTKDTNIRISRSGKVQRLIEMLEEVSEEGDAAIIFTQFATFATLLHTVIEEHFGTDVLLLTGETQRTAREELIDRFMRPDGPQFFIISLKAGGTGLNLTRANHVFHIDRWWNPAVEDQATDRAFRIGQTRDVHVHLMIAAGTLEERIDELLIGKRSLANEILAGGEDWLTSLSTEELIDVITLRESVFEEF